MTQPYQTHASTEKGMSDSARKLDRLRIPLDLRGKSLLDIGCNEGYFCNAAAVRGAMRVVGIDVVKANLDFAKAKYPSPVIEWHHQAWDALPRGPFDVVLWASAMHYELDPAKVICSIVNNLTPNGLFILECGIGPGAAQEMVLVQRHSDSRWYPTQEFLTTTLLAPFAFRRVANPEMTEGDPIPRVVYHCNRRLPTVLLFRGDTHHGKTSAARHFASSVTKVISLDVLVYRIASGTFHHGAAQRFIKSRFNPNDLTSLYKGLDSAGLTAEYMGLVVQAVAASDASVIIEGLMTDTQAATLTDLLRGRAVVWDATRLFPS